MMMVLSIGACRNYERQRLALAVLSRAVLALWSGTQNMVQSAPSASSKEVCVLREM